MRNFETTLLVNAENFPAQFRQLFAALPRFAIWGHIQRWPRETKWAATYKECSYNCRARNACRLRRFYARGRDIGSASDTLSD
jgi:hypothetical protein